MSDHSIPSESQPAPTKICTKCGKEFPANTEHFYAAKHGRLGLTAVCRSCASEIRKRYYREHIDQERSYREEHKAEARDYHRKWRERNRERQLKYWAEYRERNIEKCREWGRKYSHTHPEEVRVNCANRYAAKKAARGIHTVNDIHNQYEFQRGRCFYCGKKVGDKYHVDHVVPLALGGSNGPENLVISCPKCNMKKSATHPMDWCGRLF